MLRTPAPFIGALGVMRNRLTLATHLALVASSTVAVSAMIHGAGKFEWNRFYPWVLGPYIVLFAIQSLPMHKSEARQLASSITSGLALIFTCWFYVAGFWFSASSTAALIFIFAPIYLLVGGVAVWVSAWFVFARRLKAQQKYENG